MSGIFVTVRGWFVEWKQAVKDFFVSAWNAGVATVKLVYNIVAGTFRLAWDYVFNPIISTVDKGLSMADDWAKQNLPGWLYTGLKFIFGIPVKAGLKKTGTKIDGYLNGRLSRLIGLVTDFFTAKTAYA